MKSESFRQNSIHISEKFLFIDKILLVIICTTLIVIPFTFDAFTISKLLILNVGLTILLTFQLLFGRALPVRKLSPMFYFCFTGFVISLSVSAYESGVPLERSLFGQYGRGNGLLYYYLACLVLLVTSLYFGNMNYSNCHNLMTLLAWILAIYALLQSLSLDFAELDTRDLSAVVLTFGNSNFAGAMLSILFTYQLIYTVRTSRYNLTRLLLIVSLALSITLTNAVQGYFIIVFACIIGISLKIRMEYPSVKVLRILQGLWITLSTFLLFGAFDKTFFSVLFQKSTFQMRIEYWKIASQIIADKTWLGIGPDKFYDVSPQYMAPGSLKIVTSTRIDNAHNWFLNLGANFGLLSIIFFLLILFVATAAAYSYLQDAKDMDPFIVASSACFYSILLVASVSIEQIGQGIWLYFFMGVLIGSKRQVASRSTTHIKLISGLLFIKRKFVPILNFALILLLSASTILISNRIILDASLRSEIQKINVGKLDPFTLERMSKHAIDLRAEPEYSVKALDYFAKLGDVVNLDRISQEVYVYNPDSIQAMAIRENVLFALGRKSESCKLVTRLLQNTPWDNQLLNRFLVCHQNTILNLEEIRLLKRANNYLPKFDKTSLNLASKGDLEFLISILNQLATRAQLAKQLNELKVYDYYYENAQGLLERISEVDYNNLGTPLKEELIQITRLLEIR